jgi:NAD(P)-dependent dehydrogenase (short-subunit alcohol dehydrogenase family)
MGIDLAGARVLVTGASSGIGRATAVALARAGARLAVGARRRERLLALAAELAPAQVVPLDLDVSDRDSCERFVASAVEALGGVDVLVNNAGLGQWMAVRDTTPEQFDRLLKTNVYGPYWLSRAVLPHLEARGRGAIVQVASALAHRALPNMATYCATKAFLLRFSEALRVEVRRRGVDVIVVSPGIVRSEFAAAAVRPGGGGERGRPEGAPPETVARAIVAGLTARRPPREIFPQRQGQLFRTLNPHVPALFDRAFAKLAD